MRFTLKIVTIFAALTPIITNAEATCWESLREVSKGLAQDQSCVAAQAKDPLKSLCAADGIKVNSDFRTYLSYRSSYMAVREEANKYIAAHPGQYPAAMAAKLHGAETDWIILGRRYQIENRIEALRRQSATCR